MKGVKDLLSTTAAGNAKQKGPGSINSCFKKIETLANQYRTAKESLEQHKKKSKAKKSIVPKFKHKNFYNLATTPTFMSYKTTAALTIVKRWMAPKTKPKAIVFCVFLQQLELLKDQYLCQGWKTSVYSGEMTQAKKDEAIAKWEDDDDCPVLLMSLKAGGKSAKKSVPLSTC